MESFGNLYEKNNVPEESNPLEGFGRQEDGTCKHLYQENGTGSRPSINDSGTDVWHFTIFVCTFCGDTFERTDKLMRY